MKDSWTHAGDTLLFESPNILSFRDKRDPGERLSSALFIRKTSSFRMGVDLNLDVRPCMTEAMSGNIRDTDADDTQKYMLRSVLLQTNYFDGPLKGRSHVYVLARDLLYVYRNEKQLTDDWKLREPEWMVINDHSNVTLESLGHLVAVVPQPQFTFNDNNKYLVFDVGDGRNPTSETFVTIACYVRRSVVAAAVAYDDAERREFGTSF
jgi:hypothetical protein